MDKLARYIIITAAIGIIAFITWYFSEVIVYILVAAVLSLVGKPFVDWICHFQIKNHHLPRGVAAIFMVFLMIVVILGLLMFLIPIITDVAAVVSKIDINQVSGFLEGPLEKANEWMHTTFPDMSPSETLEGHIWKYCVGLVNPAALSTIFGSVASFVANAGVAVFSIVFITFYFLKEPKLFWNIVSALVPDRHEGSLGIAADKTKKLLQRYFVGILAETIVMTILITAGLCIFARFNFALAVVLGLIFGILNIIPYVGPLIGGGIGVIMGVVTHYANSGYSSIFIFILVIIAVYVGSNMLDTYFLQPYIYSSSVKAHPLEIFIVILIAGFIGGALGMLIAIPAYTVMRVFAGQFLSKYKIVQRLVGQGEISKG